MRIVFMGTPDFAVPFFVLRLLRLGMKLRLLLLVLMLFVGVVRSLSRLLVKAKALELGLPVIEVNRMTPDSSISSRLPMPIFSVWLPMVAFCLMRCCIWRRLVL